MTKRLRSGCGEAGGWSGAVSKRILFVRRETRSDVLVRMVSAVLWRAQSAFYLVQAIIEFSQLGLLRLKLASQFSLMDLYLLHRSFGLVSFLLQTAQRVIEIFPPLWVGGFGDCVVDGLKPLLNPRLLCAAVTKFAPHVIQLPGNVGHLLLLHFEPFYCNLDPRSDLSGVLKRDPKLVNLRQQSL